MSGCILSVGGETIAKIGKAWTVDTEVYNWLQKYCEDNGKKQSFMVNAFLKERLKPIYGGWICPECQTLNKNIIPICYNCDYKRDFSKGD